MRYFIQFLRSDMFYKQPGFKHPTLIGLSAILMWSATVGIFRSVSEIFGPTAGAALIFSAGGFFACLMTGLPNLKTFPRPYLWIGGSLFVLYEVMLALSIGLATDRVQAIELGMINYLWPSLTILFAVIAGQQRGSWLLIPSMALCFVGIIWVMKGDSSWSLVGLWGNIQSNPWAYGMAFCAAITWALYSVFTRRFGQGANGVPLFLVVTAMVLWIKYVFGVEAPIAFNAAGVTEVLVMGLLMATAYSSWNYSIQHGNITVLATISYFTPVLSVLLASFWLNINPGMSFLTGVGLVTLGSLLSGWVSTLPEKSPA